MAYPWGSDRFGPVDEDDAALLVAPSGSLPAPPVPAVATAAALLLLQSWTWNRVR
jgi:hypothetical protein